MIIEPEPVVNVLVVGLNPTFQETMIFNRLMIGEVNRAISHRFDASGKGMNVARVLSQLKVPTLLLTHLGGGRIQEFLDEAEKDRVPLLWTDSQSPIRTCITVLDRANGLTTELVQEPKPVDRSTEGQILTLFRKAITHVQWVIISGTRAPGYRSDFYAMLVEETKQAGKSILLDYRGDDLLQSLTKGADVVKPNLSEFLATFFADHPPLGEQEESESLKPMVLEKMRSIWDSYGSKTIITRGSRPLWAWDGSVFHEVEPLLVAAQSTIGCGDAFSAGFVAATIDGNSFGDALIAGRRAAALNAKSIRPGSLTD